jgi:hypothetical protein
MCGIKLDGKITNIGFFYSTGAGVGVGVGGVVGIWKKAEFFV